MMLFENLYLLVEMGGPVMLPICFISAWLWGLIILKADWLRRVKKNQLSLDDALDYLEDEQEALKVSQVSSCPRARALSFFMGIRARGGKLSKRSEHCLLEVAIKRQTNSIEQFLPAILILAATAPLLGLFGTVSGMINTFQAIGSAGMSNAQAMASGIREAMITTQAGLLVAIPGIFIGQFLKRQAARISSDLQVFHNGLSQWIDKEYKR